MKTSTGKKSGLKYKDVTPKSIREKLDCILASLELLTINMARTAKPETFESKLKSVKSCSLPEPALKAPQLPIYERVLSIQPGKHVRLATPDSFGKCLCVYTIEVTCAACPCRVA